ncbi:hypothetical protein VNO80_28200 [Phaseolus coccineus]|uniref:Uncharacterized protein n=1 Tax=Phaseolus coccineus TaxID=3886 RepID=A0AAN9LKU5_PHACN
MCYDRFGKRYQILMAANITDILTVPSAYPLTFTCLCLTYFFDPNREGPFLQLQTLKWIFVESNEWRILIGSARS